MNKLPVFRTFGNALAFTFGNFLTIFRLAWLPFALYLGAVFALSLYLGDIAQRIAGRVGKDKLLDPFSVFAELEHVFYAQIVLIVLQAIAVAAVAVSIHRVILFGDRKPGVYFGFAFGATEFLYLVMGLIWSIFVLAIIAAALAPAVYFVTNGDVAGFVARFKDLPTAMPAFVESQGFSAIVFAYFIGWVVALFVCLRLAVWPPSIVATGRLLPAEPWRLTRGNAWRLIGLFVLTVVAIWVVVVPATAAFFYQIALDAVPNPQIAQDPAALQEAMRQAMERRLVKLAPYAPLLWFIQLLGYVFATALGVALISYSYKALKGYDAGQPIPSDH